ncbi:MAG: DUF692 family multinuclear iron-containing protein [Candidatus Poseidoniia archaeon]
MGGTLRHVGAVSTLVEWDANIPDFDRLEEEALRARALYDEIATDSTGSDAQHEVGDAAAG